MQTQKKHGEIKNRTTKDTNWYNISYTIAINKYGCITYVKN